MNEGMEGRKGRKEGKKERKRKELMKAKEEMEAAKKEHESKNITNANMKTNPSGVARQRRKSLL